MKLWNIFLCSFNIHQDSNGDGSKGNFCEACGHQTNHEAFSSYLVSMKDGETVEVTAINEFHAKNLVVYAGDTGIDGRTGQPLGDIKVHPDNIASVEKLGSDLKIT